VTQPKTQPFVPREPLAPWLTASFLVMLAFTFGVLVGTNGSPAARVMLTVALCSVVTAGELVAYRSWRGTDEASRVLRERPAAEELQARRSDHGLAGLGVDTNLPPYAVGMLRYSAAVAELLDHAVNVAANEGHDVEELVAARDDAVALHELLQGMDDEPVGLQKAAKVHTICALWDANQDRYERAAAEIDREYHTRWRARHLASLRLRHGEPPRRSSTTLPYRVVTTAE
jgi:hypothetical protein